MDVESIPESWTIAKSDFVCTKIQDGTHFSPKNQFPTGVYRYVTAKNVRQWGLDLSDITYLSEGDHRTIYARCDTRKGDVLLVKDGVNTGDAAINTVDEEISLLSSVCFLRPDTSILESPFLRYFLLSPGGQKQLLGQMTGTAIKRIVLNRIRQLEIPIPPLAEQRRIVAEIETQLTRLDAAVAALKRAQANLKRYRAAVLKAAVERCKDGALRPDQRLPESTESWRKLQISDLLARSEYGTSVKCDYDGMGPPVLRIPNIAKGVIDITDLKRSIAPLRLDHDDALRAGDLLICRTNGSIDLVGRTAVITNDFESDYTFASYLLRLRFKDGKQIASWVHLFLNSPQGRRIIEGNAASSAGQNNVSLGFIQRIEVPIPPDALLPNILDVASSRLSSIEAIDASIAQSFLRAKRLRQSILRKAFSGEIVPQDPDDEPASVLLERIRAERAAQKPVMKAGRFAKKAVQPRLIEG